MRIRKRIDRFLEDALVRFSNWINENNWRGKERDCINLYATRFLHPAVHRDAAICDYSQVRIECAVPQIAPSLRNAVTKDLVIWKNPDDVTWDADWNAAYLPWVIVEWKATRRGSTRMRFSQYDTDWLERFTGKYPGVFGYTVTVDIRSDRSLIHYAQIRSGSVTKTKSIA